MILGLLLCWLEVILSLPHSYSPLGSVPTLPSVAATGSYLFWELSLSSLNPERKNHKARCSLGSMLTLRLTLGSPTPPRGEWALLRSVGLTWAVTTTATVKGVPQP